MNSLERYNNKIFAYQYEYSERNKSNNGDIEYYIEKLKDKSNRVLELGCGSGRITIPLKKAGIDIVAQDQAQAMIELAREKATAENLNIDFILSDAIYFKSTEKYSAIIFPYNSIRLIDNDKLELLVLGVKDHLERQGRFLFDLSSISCYSYDKNGQRHVDWSEETFIKELNVYLKRKIVFTAVADKQIIENLYFWKIRDATGQTKEIQTKMNFSSLTLQEYIDLFKNYGFSVIDSCLHKKGKHSFCELFLP